MSRRFSKPYAQALLATAGTDEAGKAVRDEIGRYAEAARQVAGLERMASNPAVPLAVKEEVLSEVCRMLDIGKLGQSLLALLLRNFRLIHLDSVLDSVDVILNRRLGIVVANVTTAQPLNEANRRRLQEVLAKIFKKDIDLTVATDPKLLGGFVARIGSYRYDASVEGQLGRLAGALAQGK